MPAKAGIQTSSRRRPESRKYLIILDTGLRRYDIIADFMQFYIGLGVSPIKKLNLMVSYAKVSNQDDTSKTR
jgi:hypothetical protein